MAGLPTMPQAPTSAKVSAISFVLSRKSNNLSIPAFWDFGHELYRSTPETFTATCLVGDVLDPAFLPAGEILTKAPDTPCPNFRSLTSCFPLAGRVSVIYVTRFFHLFDERKQLELALKLAALLSPDPGSTIFGAHIGIPERSPGNNLESLSTFFCHSPESWRKLWQDTVFLGHAVKIDATVSLVPDNFRKAGSSQEYILKWSVVRLQRQVSFMFQSKIL